MPIRQALNRLAFDRLVQDIPQRGYIVRTVSFSEAVAAFRLRELLETEAAGEAARRITDADIEMLRNFFYSDEDIFLRHYNFHTTVARLSGNRLLADFVEELMMLTQRLLPTHPQTIARDFQQELDIIDALATRDPETARAAMRQHIQISVNELFNNHYRTRPVK
jgi:DNA-binding GntR family transcriptional regulator